MNSFYAGLDACYSKTPHNDGLDGPAPPPPSPSNKPSPHLPRVKGQRLGKDGGSPQEVGLSAPEDAEMERIIGINIMSVNPVTRRGMASGMFKCVMMDFIPHMYRRGEGVRGGGGGGGGGLERLCCRLIVSVPRGRERDCRLADWFVCLNFFLCFSC